MTCVFITIIYRPIPYLPECVHVHVLLEYCLMYTLTCTCLKVWLHTLYIVHVHMLPSYHATSRPDFDFTETISMIPGQLFMMDTETVNSKHIPVSY